MNDKALLLDDFELILKDEFQDTDEGDLVEGEFELVEIEFDELLEGEVRA